MARKERLNVDYFPHIISRGKKLSYIEGKYGNDGYATWFKLLEELGDADQHFLDMRDVTNLMFVSGRCLIKEEKLVEIIDDLVKFGEFDKDLWEMRILWSKKFSDNIEEAWKRRATDLIRSADEIMQFLNISLPNKEKKPQRAPKAEKIEHDIIYPWETDSFKNAWFIWKEYKRVEKKFQFKSKISEQQALIQLNNYAKGSEDWAIFIIKKSISNGWSGHFAPTQEDIKNANGGHTQAPVSKSTVSNEYLQKLMGGL